MKLTPFAKLFVTVVVLAVVGYTGWHYYSDQIRCWASPTACAPRANGAATDAPAQGPVAVSRSDFDDLSKAPADPGRAGLTVTKSAMSTGKLGRPLRVGINTWAGHAPGLVANLGLTGGKPSSIFMKAHSLNVEFKIIEDPAAKFAAFQAGQIDVMWDTVDSWAREASVLAEKGSVKGKSVIMEDWSRGGDGVIATTDIKSVEDLAGKRIATTEFTPSHRLLLYLLNQSGLSAEQKAHIEKTLVITQDAPAAAAMFKSGKVDAAVTWEPDLSAAVAARGDQAHVLVSTTAATNVIADTLVARQDIIDQAPETIEAFVAGWLAGIDYMKKDPAGANAIVADALKLDTETVAGMLSGLKLTAFADNAQIFGLNGQSPHYVTLFNAAFRIWRKKGVVSKAIDGADEFDGRFVGALADQYKGQQVVEPSLPAKKPSSKDVPIINKTLSINFTPASDELMPGSLFTLDSLGETMTSFGQTYLRIEGNTDATGSRPANIQLSQRRAEAVKNYLVKQFSIPVERFQTLGHGPDRPVAPNSTETGRQLNRRTDIKVVLAAQ